MIILSNKIKMKYFSGSKMLVKPIILLCLQMCKMWTTNLIVSMIEIQMKPLLRLE